MQRGYSRTIGYRDGTRNATETNPAYPFTSAKHQRAVVETTAGNSLGQVDGTAATWLKEDGARGSLSDTRDTEHR